MNFNISDDFLGRGWKFPVEFKKELKTVVMITGEEDIRNSLDILFSTRIGERIMHTKYGSALSGFVFMPMNLPTKTYMLNVIGKSILFNEPRIVVTNIEITESFEETGRLDVSIEYKIPATNSRYNYVYPFYMQDASNLER